MRNINNNLNKLKRCPFCGNYPDILNYTVEASGYSELDLRCCMVFHIESELTTFHGVNEYGRSEVITFNGKNPIDIWNERAPRRKRATKKEKK